MPTLLCPRRSLAICGWTPRERRCCLSVTKVVEAEAGQVRTHVAIRLHLRARLAVHHGRLCADDRAYWHRGWVGVQGAPAHAQARVRLRAGQQRPRHAGPASLPRPPKYPAHGAIHRVVAGQVQGLLAVSQCAVLATASPLHEERTVDRLRLRFA
jgi:hypothetical protein